MNQRNRILIVDGVRAMKHAALKFRDFDLELKADADASGVLTGYGSVFGVVDSYNEVVAPGAFKESLAEIEQKGRPVPLLWQHRSGEPIGIWTKLKEDDTGLKLAGQLAVGQGVPRADEAFALSKLGAVSGLSIGYYVREDSYDEKTRVRTLKRLDLVEVSLVTFPANDDARVDTIKAKLAHGTMPTLRQFETLCREAGFSKSQAARIAERGYLDLLDRGTGGEGCNGENLKAALADFKLPTF
jgi:HK97 family phage prohead protease